MIPARDTRSPLVAPLSAQPDPTAPPSVSPTPMMMATAVDPPITAPTASIAPAPAPAPATSTPDDRATTFQAVEGGGTETRSGETLLVEAYVVLWVILMGWLFLTWRRQSVLSAQLDDLEKTIDKKAAAAAKPEKK